MAFRRMILLNFRRFRTFNQSRTILSNVYKCSGEWESRKNLPALKDVDICTFNENSIDFYALLIF